MTLIGAGVGGLLSAALRRDARLVPRAGAIRGHQPAVRWLSLRGHDLPALILVISADNLSAGIASAAFVAYLSSLTNVAYSATQYAIFSSIMLLLPKFIAGWSGLAVDSSAMPTFFVGTALLGAPSDPDHLAGLAPGRRAEPAGLTGPVAAASAIPARRRALFFLILLSRRRGANRCRRVQSNRLGPQSASEQGAIR